MFPTYKNLNLPKISNEILSFWETERIFEKSIETREGEKQFIFFEGPPSANGLPGIHHVLARTIKDIFCRYKTQKGYQVKRRAGWDTHGLPVELGVEKDLGITKVDIGKKISIDQYNDACKKAVMRYTGLWNDLTLKMGYWVDTQSPYITYKSKYIESVWWLLANLYKKDLIYKGYTIQPYSPVAGTGLSSHELNQPGCYRKVTDTSVTAQFRAKYSTLPKPLKSEIPLYILAWTTTPWTLPSNTALTVGAKIMYVVIQTFNQYTDLPIRVLLAEKLVEKYFNNKYKRVFKIRELINTNKKQIPFFIEQKIVGKQLENIKYEQIWEESPLPFKNADDAFRIILGDFVTTDEGTGIVHTAPTFGADDARVAMEASPKIPPLLILDENNRPTPLVNFEGKFRHEIGSLGGKYVKNEYYSDEEKPNKSVDVEIAIKLKEGNKAFLVEKHTHSYPHCWRTDKPILYYPLDSWFINIQKNKKRMVELNKKINWKPLKTGEGRFGKWLENANDWNLSRSRFWGIPLPIWKTEDGNETKIISSINELKNELQKSVEHGHMIKNPISNFVGGDMSNENYEKVDLHKQHTDKMILTSSTGKPMFREKDLIDVWFDSGSMPYAQWHYPFENKEKIESNESFPADYIAEGVDQTRGWFYTLHAISTLIFDSVAYKNVISNGLVLDKNGQKMSKRLGNTIDPFETINKYGADPTRWYMISNSNPWDNLKFDIEGIKEVNRKFFGTLYNTYSFFSLYANIDSFCFSEKIVPIKKRPEIDKWVLSELNTLIIATTKFYDNYEPTKACRLISKFVIDDLSNWYVRLSRRRFWKGSYEEDKIAAYQTLYECLIVVSKIMAPVAPFYSEMLYRDLNGFTKKEKSISVHLAKFPYPNESLIDKKLEARMQTAQKICSLVLSLRKKEKIRVRQPLKRIMLPVVNAEQKKQIEYFSNIILNEVNVKEIEFMDDTSSIFIREIKVNYQVLGPKLGSKIKQASELIGNFTKDEINRIEKGEKLTLKLKEREVKIGLEDVSIKTSDAKGWVVASEGNLTVALDIKIDNKLKLEGLSRELVNRMQIIRKEAGLDVTDKIHVTFTKSDELLSIFAQNKSYIKSEILASEIIVVDEIKSDGKEIIFESFKTKVNIVKSL